MTETTQTTSWSNRYDSFEDFLRGLRSNKAALADLRSGRGKTPEQCQRMHRWVAGFVGDTQVDTGRERAIYTTASLFASSNQLPESKLGLGGSLKELTRTGRFSTDGIEARLIRLARSPSSAELCRNLQPIVSLLSTAGIPISWSGLASDIDGWDFRSDQISRRWLRAFFKPNQSTSSDAAVTKEP